MNVDVRLTTEYQNTSVETTSSQAQVSIYNDQRAKMSAPVEVEKNDLLKIRQNHIKQDIQPYKNISYQDALNFIKTAFGYDENEFGTISEAEFTHIEGVLSSALTFPAKNEKYNSKKLVGIAKFYNKAIENGNTADQARELVDNFGDMNLVSILKAYNPELNKYSTLSDVPKETLEASISNLIDRLKESGNKNNILMFRNLLDRTSDDDKKILWEAFKNVASSNEKVQMLSDTINKFENKEKLQNFLKSFTPEQIHALGLEDKDVTSMFHLLAKNLDEDGVKQIQQLSFKFAEQINAKVHELKNKKEEELTEEDKLAIQTLKFIGRSMTGLMTGTQENSQLSSEVKEEINNQIIDESKDLNIYQDVLNNLAEYANEHPEFDMKDALDKYTNGDFSKTYESYKSELAASNQETTNTETTSNGSSDQIGFAQIQTVDVAQAKEVQQTKINNFFSKEDNKITVEKNEEAQSKFAAFAPSLAGRSVVDLTKMIEYGTITTKNAVKQSLKQYSQLTTSVKSWVEDQVERMSKGARNNLLATTAGSAVVKIVSHTNINPDEVDTKSIGYDARKALERVEEQREMA